MNDSPSPQTPTPKPLTLLLKGACMGLADVIPGVSGGTIALILGIYQQFIEAIRSVNPKPLFALGRWIASGFKADKRQELLDALETIHLRFLIPLGMGIVGAVAVGAMIIPTLMENFPQIMRGLFFGLILASIVVPWKMIPRESTGKFATALVLAALAAVAGYTLTDPNTVIDTSSEWVEVQSQAEEPEKLKDVIRRGPSSLTSEQVYWSDKNEALRKAIEASAPETAQKLAESHAMATGVVPTDKKALKALAKPYDDLMVPPKTTLSVPRPGFVFIFFAGAIAICAMVLPGVSGSFLLLVMGAYYFVLNALKGTLTQLAHLELPINSILYLALFIGGIAVGILSFARVLSWLLRHQPGPTMGVLMGLMIGCLRAIWPYQQTVDGTITNVIPQSWGGQEIGAVVAIVAGIILVTILSRFGQQAEDDAAPAEAA